MKKTAGVKKNAIYNLIKTLSTLLFPLISFPYASRTLLADSMGKVNFGNSIVSYFTLFAALGISIYAIRECAKVKDDKEALERVSGQLFTINLWATLFSYAALAVTLLCVPKLKDYRTLIVIQSSAIMFITLGADWLNSAMSDFKYISIRTILFHVASLVAMFIFVHEPDDYLKYAVISLVSTVASNLLNIFYRRRYCKTKIVWKLDLKKHMPPIILMFSLQIAQTVLGNTAQAILGFTHGDYEVGIFSTALRLYTMVNTTVASIAYVVMPKMSQCFAKNDYGGAGNYFNKAFNFTVVFGLPCVIGLALIADDVMMLVGGMEYFDSIAVVRILMIALPFALMGGLVNNVLNIPSGREKIGLIACISASVVCIGLDLIFVPKYGVKAAAIIIIIAEAVSMLINIIWRNKNVRFGRLFETVFPPIIAVVVMGAVVVLVNLFIPVLVIRVFVAIASAALAYLLVLVLMRHKFTMEMLMPYVDKVKRKLGRKKEDKDNK